MNTPIITINYNGSKDTLAMISSLSASGENFDLIIVDNKSPRSDELKVIEEYIEKTFNSFGENLNYSNENIEWAKVFRISENNIILLQGKDNYGFSKGTNIGLKYALEHMKEAEYLAILNNDTEVTEGFLSKVIEKIEKFDLAAAMGTILYYGYDKPYIWSIGGPIDWIKAQGIHVNKNNVYTGCEHEIVERQFISGCYTVFKRWAIEEIGLLDEDYFFAGEEYQYSYTLSKKYKLAWVPSSIIYHKSLLDEGNGSSHRIADLCWQYNAYMVKIVFVNKNKSVAYRVFWHFLFKMYVQLILKKRYLNTPEYGEEGYIKLKKALFNNIKRTSFTYKDFIQFKEG